MIPRGRLMRLRSSVTAAEYALRAVLPSGWIVRTQQPVRHDPGAAGGRRTARVSFQSDRRGRPATL